MIFMRVKTGILAVSKNVAQQRSSLRAHGDYNHLSVQKHQKENFQHFRRHFCEARHLPCVRVRVLRSHIIVSTAERRNNLGMWNRRPFLACDHKLRQPLGQRSQSCCITFLRALAAAGGRS
ncbi:hypothetical protein MARPO_0031s0172 [Marchantia polymorpha]|uniref:Uncharacterized protein n=1 Tax=Marchantia polymorpha TaxID=3197 RepID=A0A2R6X7Y3_MARPO|nr:hypothetical protein MARPO_0031s0172 [Marchantia polymorpha]|eukprot:PTQ42210.1 hypothetical protein MARPO_0031s0172 [Marchantia polymorpha]